MKCSRPISSARLDRRIQRQLRLVAAAREAAAVEADLAHDYVVFGAGCFYRPTLPHLWILLEMERMGLLRTRRAGLVLGAYVLLHSAEEVRNRLFRALALDAGAVQEAASRRFAGDAGAVAVAAVLLEDLHSGEAAPLEAGWWAAVVDLMAGEYHWSEQEIFSTPLVRLAAYSREILSRRGGSVVPVRNLLPEERELRELYRKRMEMNQHEQYGKPEDGRYGKRIGRSRKTSVDD